MRQISARTVAIAVTVVTVLAAATIAVILLARPGDVASNAAADQTTQPPPSATAPPTPATCPNGRLANGDCTGGSVAANPLANDPVAPLACPKILKAQGTQAIYDDPDTMQAIGEQAATSLDRDLAFAGGMLAQRAKLARAQKKLDPNDVKSTLDMGTAATQLATVCTKAGFQA